MVASVALILVWLAVGGATGSHASQLAEVQTNEGSAFLPDESEAARVMEIRREFKRSSLLPAVAVFEYDREVDDSDLAAVERSSAELTGDHVQSQATIIPGQSGTHGYLRARATHLLADSGLIAGAASSRRRSGEQIDR